MNAVGEKRLLLLESDERVLYSPGDTGCQVEVEVLHEEPN